MTTTVYLSLISGSVCDSLRTYPTIGAMKGDMPGKREGLSFIAKSDIRGAPPINQNAMRVTMQRHSLLVSAWLNPPCDSYGLSRFVARPSIPAISGPTRPQ